MPERLTDEELAKIQHGHRGYEPSKAIVDAPMKVLTSPAETDPYRQYDVIIQGVFLWADEGAAMHFRNDTKAMVRGCTIMVRPKWWQLWRWWQALRAWLRPSPVRWWEQ